MELLVAKGATLKDLDIIAKKIIVDKGFREAFLEDAETAASRLINYGDKITDINYGDKITD